MTTHHSRGALQQSRHAAGVVGRRRRSDPYRFRSPRWELAADAARAVRGGCLLFMLAVLSLAVVMPWLR